MNFFKKISFVKSRNHVGIQNYRFTELNPSSAKIAVVVHLYYPDLWEKISLKLLNINQDFDLYISTPIELDFTIDKLSKFHRMTSVVVVPNRGRDVLPFLMILDQIRPYDNYDKVLKIHSKKSKHRDDGSDWFGEILDDLLPRNIKSALNILSEPDTGIIGPSSQIVSLSRYLGDNSDSMRVLLGRMFNYQAANEIMSDTEHNPFFGGTMFWARLDFFDDLLELRLSPMDFPDEQGQVDGTIAHAIERIIGKAAHRLANKEIYQINDTGIVTKLEEKSFNDYYAHV